MSYRPAVGAAGARAAALVLALIILALVPAGAGSQQPERSGIVIDTTVPAAAQPGPDGRLDPVAATEAYLAMVGGAQRARSDSYFEGRYWLGLWSMLITGGVMLLLLQLGWSRRWRDRVEGISRGRNRQTLLYAVAFVVVTTILFLPWEAYSGFFREQQYGLMNQTFAQWLLDHTKGAAIGLVISAVMITGFYAIVRRVPRTWPLWGAAAGILFLGFTSMIAPVYIAPLFNTYTPVSDERVRQPVLQMAHANGIPVAEVYAVDQSRQTRRVSAWVSGLFKTRRVVLNDNLLERTSLPEIKAVMGHEIGHHVLNHVYEGFFMLLILLVAGFLLLQRTFDWSVAKWGEGWGVRGIGDVAGLPLLVLIFTVIGYLAGPITRTIVRSNEAEADAFGLNAAREPDGFARVALRLGEYRKLDPSPVEEVLFYTHPSGRNRIYRAMVWKAAHLTERPSPDSAAPPP